MNWYELDYKLNDSYTINHSNDGHTRDKNLKEVLTVMKDKIKELENSNMANSSILQSNVLMLQAENTILKNMIIKMAMKDYPEMVFENPQFFVENKSTTLL